jgi:hypothetical protein
MSKRDFDEEAKLFAHNCPRTWQVISARRYLVPAYRQNDYANQIDLINEFLQQLADFCSGVADDTETAIRDATLCNLALALKHNRQTYFLERELGEALMRTELPEPLNPEMIKWKFPQIRIMLPKDLILADYAGRITWLTHLDIARFDQGKRVSFPDDVVKELETDPRISANRAHAGKGPMGQEGFTYRNTGGLALSSRFVHPDFPDESMSLSVLEAWPLVDIGKLNGSICLDEVINPQNLNVLDARLKHLALNVLLFMSSAPMELEPPEELRKPSVVGERFVSGLYKARFVGDSQRKSLKNDPNVIAEKMPKETSQSPHAAHWVAGHWRQQPHGSKSSLRKLIWVQPYFAQGHKEEEAQPQS